MSRESFFKVTQGLWKSLIRGRSGKLGECSITLKHTCYRLLLKCKNYLFEGQDVVMYAQYVLVSE